MAEIAVKLLFRGINLMNGGISVCEFETHTCIWSSAIRLKKNVGYR
jgi:hypothetical protein